jgi:ribosomal-protein-alanine acetyltransferase
MQLATEQDSEWIAAIQSKANLPLWKPNSTSWVLRKKAFAIWQVAGDECELLSIAVEPAERGKGLAKMLMEYCCSELAKRGVKIFFLEARENNVAAISLYKKLGFEKFAERKKYYADGEGAIVFQSSEKWN